MLLRKLLLIKTDIEILVRKGRRVKTSEKNTLIISQTGHRRRCASVSAIAPTNGRH